MGEPNRRVLLVILRGFQAIASDYERRGPFHDPREALTTVTGIGDSCTTF